MPFDHQAQWIIIFVTILLYLATEAAEFKVVPLFRQPYTARPAITYESLIESNKRFRQWTNFDLDIFYKYLLKPLSKYVDQVRPYYYDKKLPQCESQSYDIDIRTARGCVLNVPTRIIRYLTILKDESMTRIEQLFDQHRTTAMRDFIHINLAVLHCFQDKYLTDLKPGTEEFRKLIGAGCLSSFSNAIGAFDITKVCFLIVVVFDLEYHIHYNKIRLSIMLHERVVARRQEHILTVIIMIIIQALV